MSVAERNVAQVLREVAKEVEIKCTYGVGGHAAFTYRDMAELLKEIAQKLAPIPDGEK